MEEDIDIYADLPNFNLGDNENLAETNKKISEKCSRLEKQVADLTLSLETLRKTNKNLEVNISSLLQTAKAEIARKDRMIASIRSELDDIQFRRGGYGRSAKQTRRSSPRKKVETIVEEKIPPRLVGAAERVEIVPRDVAPREEKSSHDAEKRNTSVTIQANRLNGIVNTVFGERLRKKILESQDEEMRQKERAKASAEEGVKKTSENCTRKEKINVESCRGEDLESDRKIGHEKVVEASSLPPVDSFAGDVNCEGKRRSEDRTEANNPKRFRYNDGGGRGDVSNSSRNIKPGDKNWEEVGRFQAADDETRIKGRSLGMAGENESEDKHNRVAMRLMLLSEGIDPDIRANGCVENEGKKVVEEKRAEERKGEKRGDRSRSKSRSREWKTKRDNQRSQSITPEEYYRSGRGGKQRDKRERNGRDRFERHRDSKNKDGDNLSEFSREILDLKERFGQRIDDRVGRGRSGSCNRQKRSEDKVRRNGRSRTPDSGESGSRGRIARKSRDAKRYGKSRSRSRERRKNRNSKERRCSADASSQNSKSVAPVRGDGNEVAEVVSHRKETDAETRSLVSLEDGEIVDSGGSSPRKLFDPVRSSAAKDTPSNEKADASDPGEVDAKHVDARASLPLREIGNPRCDDEKQTSNIPESKGSATANDRLNSSKDERIENIAEFIANFTTTDQIPASFDGIDTSEEKVGDNIRSVTEVTKISEEKLASVLSSAEFKDSSKDSEVVALPPVTSGEGNKTTDNGQGCEDWRLIAIDSPVKNFEENRQNRIMAINAQVMGDSEPLTIDSAEILALKNSTEECATSCVGESRANEEPEEAKSGVEETAKPALISSGNNPRKKNPLVLRTLRSIYRRGRKKMVLSDTNSEEMAKMAKNRLRIGGKKGEEISESPGFGDVDRGCKIPEDGVSRNDDASNHVGEDERGKKEGKSKPENETNDAKTWGKMGEKIEDDFESKTYEDAAKEADNSKMKDDGTGSRVEKSAESREPNVDGDNADGKEERGKVSVGGNVGVADKKVKKKEMEKLIVLARRRKPVHLEDSSASVGANANLRSSIESINNCEISEDGGTEASVPVNIDDKLRTGNEEANDDN